MRTYREFAYVTTEAQTGLDIVDLRDPDRPVKLRTRVGCGPSIVKGRVLWGYGFTLFGPPGDGGVISFVLGK